MQLMQAAHLSVCPDYEKLVFLLLDEMYIREGVVYSKHTGTMIGFVNLGDINNHMLALERTLQKGDEEEEALAKSMMAMMVRGVFSTLRFPYAHFPCEKISGELLFQPFWEAIRQLEKMGLKVSNHYNNF